MPLEDKEGCLDIKVIKAEIPCKYWGNRLFLFAYDTEMILKTFLELVGYLVPFVWE